jgi:hypothetical protein
MDVGNGHLYQPFLWVELRSNGLPGCVPWTDTLSSEKVSPQVSLSHYYLLGIQDPWLREDDWLKFDARRSCLLVSMKGCVSSTLQICNADNLAPLRNAQTCMVFAFRCQQFVASDRCMSCSNSRQS